MVAGGRGGAGGFRLHRPGRQVRLSEAVAASAAVPGLFMPMNVENFGASCGGKVPQWYQRGVADPTAPATLRASASAVMRYRGDPERYRYIKLLDGGPTDISASIPLQSPAPTRTVPTCR